jgi:cyclic pyranopterin phosphate synthase
MESFKQIKEMKLIDRFNRVHDYLRISLTDKCNLSCIYCNPKSLQRRLLHHNELLSYEELLLLVQIFLQSFSVKKIRFTGGEPLVRKDVLQFFEKVSRLKSDYDFEIGLTTNGTLIENNLEVLKMFGFNKLNISLDSLNREKFLAITGEDKLHSVLRAIEKALTHGFSPLKLNAVIIRNINDNEILDFVEFVKEKDINVRFIEFMPFTNNDWSKDGFIPSSEIRNIIEQKYQLRTLNEKLSLVSKDYELVGHKGKISFISSISDHFCNRCNRLRITAKGKMKLCLFSTGENEIDFRKMLREEKLNQHEIEERIINALQTKEEQHFNIESIIKNNQNEMISIGG